MKHNALAWPTIIMTKSAVARYYQVGLRWTVQKRNSKQLEGAHACDLRTICRSQRHGRGSGGQRIAAVVRPSYEAVSYGLAQARARHAVLSQHPQTCGSAQLRESLNGMHGPRLTR